jgi:hypothetical protein
LSSKQKIHKTAKEEGKISRRRNNPANDANEDVKIDIGMEIN